LLTKEYKSARQEFAERICTLREAAAIIWYLDKKWFYLFLRWHHAKHLPWANFKEEGVNRIQIRWIVLKAHPMKTTFMGILTKPNKDNNFNFLLSLKRLSRQEQLQWSTHHYHFHLDYHINQQILDGEWLMLHNDATYTMVELSQLIVNYFELGNNVTEMLCFHYVTHVGA
jgi:hypothetical protein